VATSAIQDFLKDHDLDVTLVVFDKSAFTISRELLGAVESYIDENYIRAHEINQEYRFYIEREHLRKTKEDVNKCNKPLYENISTSICAIAPLDDLVGNLDEPFSATLLRLIDMKGKTDVEVYKRANLDRKLFSKIRTGKGYVPSKRTVVALAVALELSIDETDDLLERAGYALSHSQKFDVIVEYFIKSGNYDIFKINEVLFKYDQPLLGA
jgi:hypothetical protein